MFKKVLKKLNNFRFTSILAACISAVAGLYALLSFVFFNFAGELVEGSSYYREVGFYYHETASGQPDGGVLSFFVFLCFIVVLICGIIVAYSAVPFIKNKEKLLPRKSILISGFVGGVFELGLVILMIMLLGEKPLTSVGLIITLPLGILTTIGQCMYLLPYLKCHFYMPEVSKK